VTRLLVTAAAVWIVCSVVFAAVWSLTFGQLPKDGDR